MTWRWYVSRGDEIFLDFDSLRMMDLAAAKLARNYPTHLPVRSVHRYRSQTPDHFHMILRTWGQMSALSRATWGLYLGSDMRRAQYILMRLDRLGPDAAADFLIADREYGFRAPDHTCRCKAKHKERRITEHCPVLQKLLGPEASAEYFALREPMRVQFGKVPLREITEKK